MSVASARFTFSRLTPIIDASVLCEILGVTRGPFARCGSVSASSIKRSTSRSTSGLVDNDEIIVVCQRWFAASFSSARSLVEGCCAMNGASSLRARRTTTDGSVAITSTMRCRSTAK